MDRKTDFAGTSCYNTKVANLIPYDTPSPLLVRFLPTRNP